MVPLGISCALHLHPCRVGQPGVHGWLSGPGRRHVSGHRPNRDGRHGCAAVFDYTFDLFSRYFGISLPQEIIWEKNSCSDSTSPGGERETRCATLDCKDGTRCAFRGGRNTLRQTQPRPKGGPSPLPTFFCGQRTTTDETKCDQRGIEGYPQASMQCTLAHSNLFDIFMQMINMYLSYLYIDHIILFMHISTAHRLE